MLGTEHRELLEDGKVLLFTRNGIFQARYYKGGRSYIYKTLKTTKLDEGRKRAVRFMYEMEFRKEAELPLQQKSFNDVISEYVAMRQRDYEQGQHLPANSSNQQHTSIYMLRQTEGLHRLAQGLLRQHEAARHTTQRQTAPGRHDVAVGDNAGKDDPEICT